MAALRAFRVGIVGARRVREGTGPFLAAYLHAAGCKVVAVAGTSLDSAAIAARELATSYGIVATPHESAGGMIERERLDALVIATPPTTHEALLRLALDASLHVLCEKPFVYGGEDGWADRGFALMEGFAAKGLCVVVNAQWRHALPAYMRLFPDVTPRAAKTFEMTMSPSVGGRDVVPVAMPHPLSLMTHLWPATETCFFSIGIDGARSDAPIVHAKTTADAAECTLTFRVTAERPRPFSFGFDGSIAHRVLREPGYRMALRTADGSREVALPDPVETVVKDFVARVRKGPPHPVDRAAARALRLLAEVDDAWPASTSRS